MSTETPGTPQALARFKAQLPMLRVWIAPVLSAHGGSARDLVEVGARALWRACVEHRPDAGVPLSEVAELAVTSDVLAARHFPRPAEPLPPELEPFQGELAAVAEALSAQHPPVQLIPYGGYGLVRTGGALAAYGPEFPVPVGPGGHGPETQPLAQVWALFKRRWPLVLAMVAVTELGVLGLSLKAPKEYKASTTLNTGVSTGNALMGQQSDWFKSGTILANMSEMLQSRTVLENTINRLGLHTTETAFSKAITVDKVPQTDLLKISAKANTAQQAADEANTVVQEFIRYYTEMQSTDARTANSFMGDQLRRAKADYDAANAQLQAFKTKFIPEAQTAVPTQLADLRAQLAEAQRAVRVDATGLSTVESEIHSLKSDPIVRREVVDNPDVGAADDRLKTLRENLADARSLYGANSPVVRDLQAQISRAAGTAQVSRVHAAQADPGLMDVTARRIQLKVQLAQDQAKLSAIQGSIGQLEQQARSASANTVTYQQLQQEVAIRQDAYQKLAAKAGEANMAVQGASDLNLNVVDPAVPPLKPESQKLPLKMALGAVIAAMFGLLVAFFQDRAATRAAARPAAEPARPALRPEQGLLPEGA